MNYRVESIEDADWINGVLYVIPFVCAKEMFLNCSKRFSRVHLNETIRHPNAQVRDSQETQSLSKVVRRISFQGAAILFSDDHPRTQTAWRESGGTSAEQ